ncbi:MAG: Lycopene cyclase [Deltaproteobacteria bacterium]|nr:Lycopene cyclase [Deltaproteobacteria bacterium]
MRERYELVIVGGGLSGLSLAHALLRSPCSGRSLLVVDRNPHDDEQRTFSYWSRAPTPFDELAIRSWDRWLVRGAGYERRVDLGAYRYRTVRGADFQRAVRPALRAHPTAELIEGDVREVRDGRERAAVRIGERWVEADWVFDSRPGPGDFRRPDGGVLLRQRFKGWVVETPGDAFDPEAPTFFDFRVPQRGAARFCYVLPYGARRALVEYVVYGPDAPDEDLRAYLEETLGVRDYRIAFEEHGVSPLSVRREGRRRGRRVLWIGVHGGRLKASTGYGYTRIQRDAAAIVRSLERRGHPFALPRESWSYRFLDALMLRVMARHGERVAEVFGAMFSRNPTARVLRFLDEEASALEALRLALTLPIGPFVRTLLRWLVLRRN